MTLILQNSTLPKGCNLYNNNSTFIARFYTFPWREKKLFTRQIKVQIWKNTLITLFMKEKMLTLAGIKQFFLFFSSFTDLVFFHLSTKKLRVRPVGNGRQSDYSQWRQ